jgi:hypothetical protein
MIMMADESVKLNPGVGFYLTETGQWKPKKIPQQVLDSAQYSGYLTIQGYRCTVFETPDKNQWAQKSSGTLASKIATRWLRAEEEVALPQAREQIEDVIKKWTTNPPDIGDSTIVSSPGSTRKYYLYAEDVNGAVIWQLFRYEHNSDQKIFEAPADSFDASKAETAMLNDIERTNKHMQQRGQPLASIIATRWLRAQDDITSQVSKKFERDGEDKDYDKAIVNFVEKTRKVLPPIDKALEKAAELLLTTRDKIEHDHPKVQDRYVQMFLQELASKHREFEDIRKQLIRDLTVELDRYEAESNDVMLAQNP